MFGRGVESAPTLKLFMRLNEGEHDEEASCGCRLRLECGNDSPSMYHCTVHDAAPKMLIACDDAIDELERESKPDDEEWMRVVGALRNAIKDVEVQPTPEATPEVVCRRCGGVNVQVAMWVRPNNHNEAIDDFGSTDDATWCGDCDDHNGVCLPSEFRKVL